MYTVCNYFSNVIVFHSFLKKIKWLFGVLQYIILGAFWFFVETSIVKKPSRIILIRINYGIFSEIKFVLTNAVSGI